MKATGFGRLDAAIGGLDQRSVCLLYGPRASGKTAFCLSFLAQGLANGERGVLVTTSRPEHILQMAEFFGWNLTSYLRSKRLLLLEYPDDIDQTASAADPSQAVAELKQLIGTEPVDRLVLDPLTPLVQLEGAIPMQRLRAVVYPILEMPSASLLVIDGERSERILGGAKDMVSSVLRFAPANQPGGPRYLRLEKHRARPATEGLYRFVLEPDNGFIDAAEAEQVEQGGESARRQPEEESPRLASIKRVRSSVAAAEWPANKPARPQPPVETTMWRTPSRPRPVASPAPVPGHDSEGRVMLIEPDGKWRTTLRQELQRSFTVMEACGSSDAASMMASAMPDAIVMSLELDGESGIELICRLRQNGWNLPIITTCRARTNSDHVAALAAGADHCLGQPIDGRILRLTVFNSLCRIRGSRRPEKPALPEPARMNPALGSPEVPCTDDLAVLYSRLEREVSHGRQNGVPFVLLTMRTTETSVVTDLACTARTLLRPTDAMLIGPNGIACLLAELPSADGFLDSFAALWSGSVPQLKRMRYEGQEHFLQAACSFLSEEIGGASQSEWMASAAGAGVANG